MLLMVAWLLMMTWPSKREWRGLQLGRGLGERVAEALVKEQLLHVGGGFGRAVAENWRYVSGCDIYAAAGDIPPIPNR